jgi:SecD/SecF fusion protein
MNKLTTKIILIAVLAVLAALAVWPPKEKIRLGKDLRGGVSLVYAVEMPEGVDSPSVLTQVIDALKRRVNPQGVLDISMTPQGRDRIEIVMPLPSEDGKALQDAFRTRLAEVAGRMQLTARELDRALQERNATSLVPAPKDGAAPAAGSRAALLAQLQSSHDQAIEARAAYQAALEQAADAATLAPIEERIASAELAERKAREALLASSVNESRLKRAFQLSTKGDRLRDDKGKALFDEAGNPVYGPSPRERELEAIAKQCPEYAGDLDALVKEYDAYASAMTGYEDPEDLKRLLRAAGVLEFHIPVSAANPQGVNVGELQTQLAERGPDGTDSVVASWYRLNDLKQWYSDPRQLEALLADPAGFFRGRDMVAAQHEGQVYVLLYDTDAMSMTHAPGQVWSMKSARRDADEFGRPCVAFQLDQQGGIAMGRLTGANLQRPMGIVLDGELYTAPTLQSQINGSGRITGNFSNEDITYLIRVLEGGELEAKLKPEPVSVSILGPALGKDNLARGFEALLLSSAATAVIMIAWYLGGGVIAVIALALNALFLFGTMAAIDGSFTLPGLAGVALSIAMAVDANVLIFERLREEMAEHKERLRDAVDIAYKRAFSAIVDGNITNLIVCVVLYKVAATEVKGFALTMAIGVITTLFTAIVVTRVLLDVWTSVLHRRSLPFITTIFPGIASALRPNIDWIGKRGVLWVGCIVLAAASLVATFTSGREMLDTEFRGGMTMTLVTRRAAGGEAAGPDGRLALARSEVEQRIRAIGEAAGASAAVAELRNASVLTVGDSTADGRASSFQIKVANPADFSGDDTATEPVVDAVANAFAKDIEVTLPLTFKGAGTDAAALQTRPVNADTLGAVIGREGRNESLREYAGGVAVLIEGISPPITLADAQARLGRMRSQPDFGAISSRETELIGLDMAQPGNPGAGYTSIVMVTVDPKALLSKVDAATWDRVVAQPEWKLVDAALTQKLSLEQVSSFSPKVAENLAASAVVAVVLSMIGMLLYIWLRFGSLRYSMATIVAVTFNVCVCLGALAFSIRTEGSAFGASTLIEGFRIDLNVISGLLTIIGYSLNDTIVILDRIRENKGKAEFATRDMVNDAINQTFSRTVLTGGATLATALILFWLGGTGIRPFAYTFLVGLIAGTASSVLIAAPLCYVARPKNVQ